MQNISSTVRAGLHALSHHMGCDFKYDGQGEREKVTSGPTGKGNL